MNQWKKSTKILAVLSAGAASAVAWLAGDPSHMQMVSTALHGHTSIIAAVEAALLFWNLTHQPKAPQA